MFTRICIICVLFLLIPCTFGLPQSTAVNAQEFFRDFRQFGIQEGREDAQHNKTDMSSDFSKNPTNCLEPLYRDQPPSDPKLKGLFFRLSQEMFQFGMWNKVANQEATQNCIDGYKEGYQQVRQERLFKRVALFSIGGVLLTIIMWKIARKNPSSVQM